MYRRVSPTMCYCGTGIRNVFIVNTGQLRLDTFLNYQHQITQNQRRILSILDLKDASPPPPFHALLFFFKDCCHMTGSCSIGYGVTGVSIWDTWAVLWLRGHAQWITSTPYLPPPTHMLSTACAGLVLPGRPLVGISSTQVALRALPRLLTPCATWPNPPAGGGLMNH